MVIDAYNEDLTKFLADNFRSNLIRFYYGDDIIGFVSAGRGVIIHRKVCPNVSYFRESRLIEAWWKPIEEKQKKKKQIPFLRKWRMP